MVLELLRDIFGLKVYFSEDHIQIKKTGTMRNIVFFFFILLISCSENKTEPEKEPEGSLFIIGGGKRPASMVKDMIRLSGLDKAGYIVILPMASSEPDTSYYYASEQFRKQGIDSIYRLEPGREGLDEMEAKLLREASMIYIPGGAQDKFMDSVRNTNSIDIIHQAYHEGAMIAGTSAGAAVQSRLMITGDQKKHPVYTGYFETIEADNMILEEGLGLIESIIVDQHFIKRQRLNRLVAVILENPGKLGVGIDESTAIHVHGDTARVYGISQVITLRNPNREIEEQDGLLRGEGLELSVYVVGDWFFCR